MVTQTLAFLSVTIDPERSDDEVGKDFYNHSAVSRVFSISHQHFAKIRIFERSHRNVVQFAFAAAGTRGRDRHAKVSMPLKDLQPESRTTPRGRNKLQAFRRDVFGRSPLRIAVALCSSEGGRIAFHKEGRVRRRTTPPSTVVNTSTVLLGPEPFVGQAGPNPHPTVLPTSAGSPRKPKFSGRR